MHASLRTLPALALLACSGGKDTGDSTGDVIDIGGARFTLSTAISDADGATTYTILLDSLDHGGAELSLDEAISYGGYATAAAVGTSVYVGQGEAPTIDRYSITEDGLMVADGSVSFLDYGLSSAGLYTNHFASEARAYVSVEAGLRAIWDPSEMVLAGDLEIPLPDAPSGSIYYPSYDRGSVNRDGVVYQPVYLTDASFYRFPQSSVIATWTAGAESDVAAQEVGCPMLDVAFADESGDLWFSAWVHAAAAPVFSPEDASETCVVRLPAGGTVDDAEILDLTEITGGRQAVALRYISDGTAIAAVFHDEDLTEKQRKDPANIYTNNWHMWRIDLDDWSGEPISGIEPFAGGYYAFNLDGRLVLLLPTDDYSQTVAYEISTDGGVSTLFSVPGWSYQMAELSVGE